MCREIYKVTKAELLTLTDSIENLVCCAGGTSKYTQKAEKALRTIKAITKRNGVEVDTKENEVLSKWL